jgi:hypothetical protein
VDLRPYDSFGPFAPLLLPPYSGRFHDPVDYKNRDQDDGSDENRKNPIGLNSINGVPLATDGPRGCYRAYFRGDFSRL